MKKFNWREYLELRPDLKKNWNGPVRAWVHWVLFGHYKISKKTKEDEYNIKDLEYNLERVIKKGRPFPKKEKFVFPEDVKIKILFYGLTRSLKFNFPFIKKNILDVLDDVGLSWHIYVHTYDDKEITNPRSGEKRAKLNYKEDIDLLPDEKITYEISSRESTLQEINVEKYLTHGNPWAKDDGDRVNNSLINLLLQFYSLKKVTNLSNIKENDKTVCLFIRPDLAYLDLLPIELIYDCAKNLDKNIIYTPDWSKNGGLNDRFSVATPSAALIYGKRLNQAEEYSLQKPLHSESFVKYVVGRFNKAGLETRALRIRADGSIAAHDVDCFRLARKLKINKIKNENNEKINLDKPCMSKREIVFLRKTLRGAHEYFEFGIGGSTVLAAQDDNLILRGVDSSKRWIKQVKNELCMNKNIKLRFVFIGLVGKFGKPLSSNFKLFWPSYSKAIHTLAEKPDVILIDGRFRVACAIQTILFSIQKNINPKILVHDCVRAEYSILYDILVPKKKIPSLYSDKQGLQLFEIKKEYDLKTLHKLYNKCKYDFR